LHKAAQSLDFEDSLFFLSIWTESRRRYFRFNPFPCHYHYL